MVVALTIAALLAYGFTLLGARIARVRAATGGPLPGLFGAAAHALAVVMTLGTAGGGGAGDPLSVLSLGLVLIWAWSTRTERLRVLGILLLGLATVLLAVGLVVPPAQAGDEMGLRVWVHLGLILAGFVGFGLSFSSSSVYLLVRARLKAKRLHDLARLPALATLDRLNARAMGWGFVVLSAGILIGSVQGLIDGDLGARLDLTIGSTFVVWGWYAVGLGLRHLGGWQGRRAALFGVGGFGSVSVLLLVAVLIQGGWHGGAA